MKPTVALSLRLALAAMPAWMASPAAAAGGGEYVYIGQLDARSALVAWGSTGGDNTIGRTGRPLAAEVEVRVEGQAPRPVRNASYTVVEGLAPDTVYRYSVWAGARRIGEEASFRTWPEQAGRLTFFVIGDYGKGKKKQHQLGAAMARAVDAAEAEGQPVRFVLTTGDNIYRMSIRNDSGSSDRHWEKKFFAPYRGVIARVPFYPALGNHDGNETGTESAADTEVYLDNFFPPGEKPAGSDGGRYYRFQFAGLAEFFALDTTTNSRPGLPKKPVFLKDQPQFTWFSAALAGSSARWRIPYFHHPMHSAGPNHRTPEPGKDLRHFDELFRREKIPLTLSGHEHNLQYTDLAKTGGVRYLLTGGGVEGDACPATLPAPMEDCLAAVHFLRIDIDGAQMRIRAITYDAASGQPVPLKRADGSKVDFNVALAPGR